MKNIMISTIRQLDLRSKPDGAFFVRLLFVVGTIFGCAVGFYFCEESAYESVESFAHKSYLFVSFNEALFYSFKYVLLLFLFGTSYVGIFLIPALSLVQAYFISSSVSSAYALFGAELLPYLLFYFIIPALFTLPCFFALADSMMSTSQRLYFFRFHDMTTGGSDKSSIKIILSVVLLLLISVYHYLLVPLIFTHI